MCVDCNFVSFDSLSVEAAVFPTGDIGSDDQATKGGRID